ncbi:helix-turn-helix domain-containing protein [Pelagimonas varians]|uniref:Uncharacterized protein n=1 Tax=Pelagimonas varians TaxID=696760 RepID=A0A238K4I9_9RHOB|nr:helix-turn-helix domain-containing protein [Pelagimonas varians]PYG30368.1 helix-turn-helix protein [Pelagimonas varians]SMX37831.1 hypothetical protein PEV8663_01214 [Pelagimonas varians]
MTSATISRYEWLKAVMQVEGLSATAKNVCTALALQFYNDETGRLNPSQETLANYLKVHKDTVKRVLRELRNAGWILSIGDGGRGKSPMLRLLSPSKIIPFRPVKGGQNAPVKTDKGGANPPTQGKERGDDLQQKGGQIIPPHYKEEQYKEHKRADVSTKRPECLSQFRNHHFAGRTFAGLVVVPTTEHSALNAWGDWLDENQFPKLCFFSIQQLQEKGNKKFFHLPSKTPPTTPDACAEARWYFEQLIDFEGASHAAQ